MKIEFTNAYEAGFDAGRYGANNFNAHYKWFNTKKLMQEWQRGNELGIAKRMAEHEDKSRKLK